MIDASWPSLVISRKLGAFYRSDIPSRAVRAFGRLSTGATESLFCSGFRAESLAEKEGRGVIGEFYVGWHAGSRALWEEGWGRPEIVENLVDRD